MTLTLCRSSMLAQFSSRRLQRYLSIAINYHIYWERKPSDNLLLTASNSKQTRHDPTIASSSQDGRHSSNQPRRPWRKDTGLSNAFKTSWTFEARSTEQVVCSPRTSSNISPPDLRPSQPSLTLPHSVCVGVPNNQSTTRAFRTTLSGLVLAGNPVSPRYGLPVYPRVVGTRILWKRKLEPE